MVGKIICKSFGWDVIWCVVDLDIGSCKFVVVCVVCSEGSWFRIIKWKV